MTQPIELISQVNGADFCQVFVVPLDALVPTELRYAVIRISECNRVVVEDLEFTEDMTQATIAAYEFYSEWLDSMDGVDPTREAINQPTNHPDN